MIYTIVTRSVALYPTTVYNIQSDILWSNFRELAPDLAEKKKHRRNGSASQQTSATSWPTSRRDPWGFRCWEAHGSPKNPRSRRLELSKQSAIGSPVPKPQPLLGGSWLGTPWSQEPGPPGPPLRDRHKEWAARPFQSSRWMPCPGAMKPKKTHHSEVKLRVFVPWKNVHTTN